MSNCLTEDQILAHLAGRGDGTALLAHIETCSSCRKLVAHAADGGDSAGWHLLAGPRENTIKIGAMVAGRYEIRRFLGRGGMGEVYEAGDTELGNPVALKTLPATTLDDPSAVSRLKAEVLLSRRVAHPNVCRIFDFGVHESQPSGRPMERLPFMTMELLSGETLGARLRRSGAMHKSQARLIVEQMVAGLAEVHRAGIIHRDLKSENVFLAKSDSGERAVLMDFGLARITQSSHASSVSQTQGLVGTVAYMSPEQVECKPLGPRSDIYALGVVMYEMMTGKLPFSGETAIETAFARVQGLPVSPSAIRPDVPSVWDRTIMKCLAVSPTQRFQRASDILDGLSLAANHRVLTRWRVAVGAGIAILVIGVVGTWRMRSPHRSVEVRTEVPHVVQTPRPIVTQAPAQAKKADSDSEVPNTVERTLGQARAAPATAAASPSPAVRPHSKGRTKIASRSSTTPVPEQAQARPAPVQTSPADPSAPSPAGPSRSQDKSEGRGSAKPEDRIYNPFAPLGGAP